MDIKILGPGCANCHKLAEIATAAVRELGIEAGIEHISDIQAIMEYTMTTPGLVVNGKLKYSGKPLPDTKKVKALIREEA